MSEKPDIRLLYVTTKDSAQARTIARQLLDERLIACANLLPQMEAIYRWKGEIQQDSECLMILKTTTALVSKVLSRVETLHSYETPCVLSLAIESGTEPYLRWLQDQV